MEATDELPARPGSRGSREETDMDRGDWEG